MPKTIVDVVRVSPSIDVIGKLNAKTNGSGAGRLPGT
jgi:hypothetical protein